MNGPFSFAADRAVKLGKSRDIRRHHTRTRRSEMTIDRTHRNALPLIGWVMSFSLLLLAAPALAGITDRDGTAEELARVRTALEAKGYSDVHDLEWEGDHFEVDARNAENRAVDLELDVETLEILHEHRD
jgi:hypothetical protein